MSSISSLIDRYFVEPFDITMAGEQVPHTSGGNYVTHLVDGHAYFGALLGELDTLEFEKGHHPYFYFANWWLGLVKGPEVVRADAGPLTSAWTFDANLGPLPPLVLDDGTGMNSEQMIDQLARLAKGFVDVRGLVWISPFMAYEQTAVRSPIWAVNVHTLLSARKLRQAYPSLRDKVVLNTLAHPLGAMHLKLVICGNDKRMTAYVGGMDLVSNRLAGSDHPPGEPWHDLAVSVQGPAAGAVYDLYRMLWNEQVARPSRRFLVSGEVTRSHSRREDFGADALLEAGTPELPPRTAPPLDIPGSQHVQVLVTLPQMNFASGKTETVPIDCKTRVVAGFAQEKLSFAPDGRFEFRVALRKAIANAQKFIYVEDQSFWAFEVMDWINQLLRSTANLKVILVWGADPADPPSSFIYESIPNHLLAGVSNPASRVTFYARFGIVVHSKVFIIDDEWASVGTANCMRRSLYTDGEVAISVLDEQAVSFAKSLRKDVWGDCCGLAPGSASDVLLDVDEALGVWDTSWGNPPPGVTLRPEFVKMKIPFEFSPTPGPGQWPGVGQPVFDDAMRVRYDQADPDSRQEF